jgi:hypothetical protein
MAVNKERLLPSSIETRFRTTVLTDGAVETAAGRVSHLARSTRAYEPMK